MYHLIVPLFFMTFDAVSGESSVMTLVYFKQSVTVSIMFFRALITDNALSLLTRKTYS